jgi:hypothetical protein
MALLDFLKKKEQPTPEPAPPTSLVDQIIGLQQQGYSNNQIIQALQKAGYTPAEISDAMNQISAMQGVEPFQPTPLPDQSASSPPSAFTSPFSSPASQPSAPQDDFERIAERIVQEKVNELRKEHEALNVWRDKTSERLDKVEQGLQDVKMDLDGLHKAIVQKIGEYDRNLVDVGTEIKAMEKVFSKVLPSLTENIQELSRATKVVKAKK